MLRINNIAVFWGILDLLSIGWYIGMDIYKGRIPIAQEIFDGSATIKNFGFPNFTFLIYIGALLFVSPILSGILLILNKKSGLILSYIQTPFRLILIIPPSIFFILWPLNDLMEKSVVLWLGFTLVLISETIKISTLIVWNKRRTT